MKQRILYGFLPAYGRDSVAAAAPVCFAGVLSGQYLDEDIAERVGPLQRATAQAFSGPGEGASLLAASSEGDVVLVRSSRDDRSLTFAIRDDLVLTSDHLARCGLRVGKVDIVDDIEAAAAGHLDTHYVRPGTYNSWLVRALDHDRQASSHRTLVRTLNDRALCYEASRESQSFMAETCELADERALAGYIENTRGPWVLKAANGAGEEFVRTMESPQEALGIWQGSQSAWGVVVGQEYLGDEEEEVFAQFLIDPAADEPKLTTAGRPLREGLEYHGHTWHRDHQAAVDARGALSIARNHHRLARELGAGAFYEVQHWTTKAHEINARLSAGTILELIRERYPSEISGMRNRIFRSPYASLQQVPSRLWDLEATGDRGEGVMVYSFGRCPSPYLMAVFINDFAGEFEREVTKLLS